MGADPQSYPQAAHELEHVNCDNKIKELQAQVGELRAQINSSNQRLLQTLAKRAFDNSAAHGFWSDGPGRNKLEMHALMHTEIAELSEAVRHNNPPSDKIPGFSQVEEELADIIIRVFDYAHGFGHDLYGAIEAKHTYNLGRPYMHGKAC